MIDAHIHLYDITRPDCSWPTEADGRIYRTVLPEDFSKTAGRLGFERAVAVEAGSSLADNLWLLEQGEQSSCIAATIGYIDPQRDDFPDILKRYLQYGKFRGIRLRTDRIRDANSGQIVKNLRYLSETEKAHVVEVLPGHYNEMGLLEPLFRNFPELRFVIDHLGCLEIDGGAPPSDYCRLMDGLSRCANVSMKVSGLVYRSGLNPAPRDPEFYSPALDTVLGIFGERRLMFGTDWPLMEKKGEYENAVETALAYLEDKGAGLLEYITRENAEGVYRI